MPVPHQRIFLQAGCPSCHPTNSIEALKTNKPVYQPPITYSWKSSDEPMIITKDTKSQVKVQIRYILYKTAWSLEFA